MITDIDRAIPMLPAWRRRDRNKECKAAWCDYCRIYHHHGGNDGGNIHRVAHCDRPDSPYHRTGYLLADAGLAPPEIERDLGKPATWFRRSRTAAAEAFAVVGGQVVHRPEGISR